MARRLLVLCLGVAAVASACVSVSTPSDSATVVPTANSIALAASHNVATAPPTLLATATSATPTPTPTPAPTTPSSTEAPQVTGRIVNTENGYAVTLPESWIALRANSDFGQLIKESLRYDPRLTRECRSDDPSEVEICLDEQVEIMESQLETFDQAGALLAFDLRSVFDPVPTLMVMVRTPGLLGLAPEVFLLTGERSLREQGARGQILSDLIDLPAGEAARFIWNTPRAMARGGIAYQYHLIGGSFVYSLVVVGHRAADELAAVADALAQSVEILPSP